MKHKVSELEGALLDAAVAKAEGVRVSMWGDSPVIEGGPAQPGSDVTTWAPSRDWAQAGPIIERQRILLLPPGVDPHCAPGWVAGLNAKDTLDGYEWQQPEGTGPTPLIAAMRAYVASKFGEEVDLP